MFLLRRSMSLVEEDVGSLMEAVTMDGREAIMPSLVWMS